MLELNVAERRSPINERNLIAEIINDAHIRDSEMNSRKELPEFIVNIMFLMLYFTVTTLALLGSLALSMSL